MSADRAPAREWFDLIVETIAVKGWNMENLRARSGVARSTIYGWRDGRGRPQAKSVNAVADVLGIPRERALRLAGIIPRPEAKPPLAVSDELRAAVEAHPDLSDAGRRGVLAAIERQLAIERGEAETSGAAGEESPAEAGPVRRHRPAS